jgi:hypothetical protein
LCFADQVEGLGHAGEHAERQHIDLHELQGLDIVLVPLDCLPILHACRLDRHEIVEAVIASNKAAGMLAQMSRRAHQLLCQLAASAASAGRRD